MHALCRPALHEQRAPHPPPVPQEHRQRRHHARLSQEERHLQLHQVPDQPQSPSGHGKGHGGHQEQLRRDADAGLPSQHRPRHQGVRPSVAVPDRARLRPPLLRRRSRRPALLLRRVLGRRHRRPRPRLHLHGLALGLLLHRPLHSRRPHHVQRGGGAHHRQPSLPPRQAPAVLPRHHRVPPDIRHRSHAVRVPGQRQLGRPGPHPQGRPVPDLPHPPPRPDQEDEERAQGARGGHYHERAGEAPREKPQERQGRLQDMP
mmetsp:Transcript_26321/g.54834  ORF Transcript_26321/g.54834 Transcript_26321/m.54834 type:complete len:260 (-) Transcript_26321:435-1214(-)